MPGPYSMGEVIKTGYWADCPIDTQCYIFACKKPILTGEMVFSPSETIQEWHRANFNEYYGKSTLKHYLSPLGFYFCETCGNKKIGYYGVNVPKPTAASPDNNKVYLTSFSFKKGGDGLKQEGFYIVDIRLKIRNPWRDPELRKKTGLDSDVVEYIKACPKTEILLRDLLIHRVIGGAKIAIGCAGGQHRSVAIVELLAARMKEYAYEPVVVHRDMKAGVSEE